MKYLDGFLVLCAFALSTVMTATLFTTFAAWAYGTLGPYERDIVATAAPAAPAPVSSTKVASAAIAPAAPLVKEVQLEPVTVVGHRHEQHEPLQVAQSQGPVVK